MSAIGGPQTIVCTACGQRLLRTQASRYRTRVRQNAERGMAEPQPHCSVECAAKTKRALGAKAALASADRTE